MRAQSLHSALTALLACLAVVPRVFADPGDLDNSFGAFGSGGGIASTGGFLNAMAVGPDGKIALAANSGISMIVKRFLEDGSPDLAFGTGGTASFTHPSFVPHPTCIAVQPDGKIVVAGWFDASPALYMVARLTVAGELDPSFDGDGWVVTDIATGPVATDMADALVIQNDGRIIVGGRSYVGLDFDFSAVRYLPDGTLDPTFNGDGKATIGFGGEDYCYDMALQEDGKLVMAGDNEGEIDTDFAVCRLTASGNLDDSFNNDGKLKFGFGHILDHCQAVTVLPNGFIIATGDDTNAAANRDDGLVGVVAQDGLFVSKYDRSQNNCSDVVAQPDNKFIVIGLHQISGDDWEVALHRLNVDGSLDPTFGNGGVDFIDLGAQDHGWRLALLPDGRFIANCNSGGFGRLLRLRPDGLFDTGGTPTLAFDDATFPPGSDEQAFATAVQADGKIVVAGDVTNAGATESDFALARFLTDGSLDMSFGVHGRVAFSFQNFDHATALTIQTDGKIVAAGYAGSGNNVNFLVARFNSDGSLDPSFGFGGFNVVDFAGGPDFGKAVAIAPDGKIVVAGNAFNGARNVFGIARLNPDGTPDLSFDIDGKQMLEFAVGLAHDAAAVVVQTDRKIVVAGTVNANFGLARLNEGGSLDNTFGLSGLTQTDMGGTDALYALALGPGGWFYAAGMRDVSGDEDFALAQFRPNGTLASCPPFPCTNWPAGKAYVDWGGPGVAYAIDVRNDGQVLAAGCANDQIAWAQFRSNTLTGGPLIGTVDFVGSECARGVKFVGTNQLAVAGFETFNGDVNMALARFETTPNSTVDVSPGPRPLPSVLLLRANAPNPFRGSTEIRYELPAASTVSLRIHDVAGRIVRTLVDGEVEGGTHSQTWNGMDDRGRPSSPGVYFVRLRARDHVAQRTVIQLR